MVLRGTSLDVELSQYRLFALCTCLLVLWAFTARSYAGAQAPSDVMPDQVTAPAGLLDAVKQALQGPRHELAAIEYAKGTSSARSSLAQLAPRLSLGVQAVAMAPFTDSLEEGVVAGPSLTWSLPTGQGRTDVSLGAAARTGYQQPIGAQAAVSTQLPLFTGPDSRRQAAEVGLKAAEASYVQAQRKIVIDAIEAYHQLQVAEERLILTTQLRELAEHEYALGRERQQHGVVTPVELYKLRSAVAAAIDDEAAARQAVVESRERLRDLVGAGEAGTGTLLAGDSKRQLLHINLPLVPAGPEDWVQMALASRIDVQAARESVSLAEAELANAKAVADREVVFTASATWPHKVTEESVDWRTDVRAGLQATFHLWNPDRAESVVALELALISKQRVVTDLERQVERDVQRALYDIAEISRSLAQAREQLYQDELLLAVAEERLATGLDLPYAVAAQELAVAQQASRVRSLEARQVAKHVALWHAVGIDPVEIRLHTP